jgi:hypothetical protein
MYIDHIVFNDEVYVPFSESQEALFELRELFDYDLHTHEIAEYDADENLITTAPVDSDFQKLPSETNSLFVYYYWLLDV